MIEFSQKCSNDIKIEFPDNQDARDIKYPIDYFDLAVTSPPYANIKEADNVIAKIYKKDPRRAYIAFKYLYDMKKNLKEVYRVLKKDGYYVVVVGNNKIRNELFENWKYIMSMAIEIGFEVENYFASEIIKHFIKVPREERIDTDWILVLKKI